MEKRSPQIRITFRMTKATHDLLLSAIEESGRSMNAEINHQLERALNSDIDTALLIQIRQAVREELAKNKAQ